MQALDRDGGGEGVNPRRNRHGYFMEQLSAGEHEDGPEAFPAGGQTVAHRFMQSRRPQGAGRQMFVETAFDAGNLSGEFSGEIHSGNCVGEIVMRCNFGTEVVGGRGQFSVLRIGFSGDATRAVRRQVRVRTECAAG